MSNYEAAHGCYPPAYTVDQHGRPLQSWRVLILPFMEEQALYEQIRLDEPWNSPHNLQIGEKSIAAFRCPSHGHHGEYRGSNITNYLAIVGPDCVFRGEQCTTLPEVADGIAQTLVVADVNQRAVPWMQPDDISAEDFIAQFDGGEPDFNHSGSITLAGFLDGHVMTLHVSSPAEVIRAATTRAAGDAWDPDEI